MRQENALQVLEPTAKPRDSFSSKMEVEDLRLSFDLNTCAMVYTHSDIHTHAHIQIYTQTDRHTRRQTHIRTQTLTYTKIETKEERGLSSGGARL